MAVFAAMSFIVSVVVVVSAFVGGDSDDCLEQTEAVDAGSAMAAGAGSAVGELPVPAEREDSSGNSRPVVWIENNPVFVEFIPPVVEGGSTLPKDVLRYELRARAWDAEDGWLDDDALVWHSSLVGNVESSLWTYNLWETVGCHVVRVFAIDSSGLTSVAETVVSVGLSNTAPVAVDDVVSVSLSGKEFFDVVFNDFDLERNINTSTLRIVVPPKLGKAGVRQAHTDSKAGKRWSSAHIVGVDGKSFSFEVCGAPLRCDTTGVLWYEATTVGSDSLVYEICDVSSRCDTATVHIHAGLADCTITGTNGNDNLYGTEGDDVIYGLDGIDTIRGRGGNDTIYSGSGDNVISGGPGNDTIHTNSGNDLILGGPGNDTIHTNSGNDLILGGSGNDLILGGPGNDTIHTNSGNDLILGGPGSDVIHGGLGLDTIDGKTREQEIGHNNRAYHDPIDINTASEGLSQQEKDYIDIIIFLCGGEAYQENEIYKIPGLILSESGLCSESMHDLCLSRLALGVEQGLKVGTTRRIVVDFLCEAASLAETVDLGYVLKKRFRGIFNINTSGYSLVFDDFRELVESNAQALSNFLNNNTTEIPRETETKLTQLLETLSAYAVPIYQKIL